MKDLEKRVAVLGESKYFVPNLEMPLYLVHLGTGEHALFQLQYGTEKSHGIESKGITSWMKLDELSEFMTELSKHLDKFEDDLLIQHKVFNGDNYINHQATVKEYKEILTIFWECFMPICNQWNSVTVMLNHQNKIKKDPKKEREDFIDGGNNSDKQ